MWSRVCVCMCVCVRVYARVYVFVCSQSSTWGDARGALKVGRESTGGRARGHDGGAGVGAGAVTHGALVVVHVHGSRPAAATCVHDGW